MQIALKNDTEMLNQANNGYSPFDKEWQKPDLITVPKGTLVEYIKEDFYDHISHKVVFTNAEGTFFAVERIKK